MPTTDSVFRRYEQIRCRLPKASPPGATFEIPSLMEIVDDISAFVFDAFGVLNVGETLIPGADRRLEQLRDRGKHIRILTNAASYNHDGAVSKFQRLGINVLAQEIITSRDAALRALTPGLWGIITTPEDHLEDIPVEYLRLNKNSADYDRVHGFLFLSSSGWTSEKQAKLLTSLQKHNRPVIIANADLAAPRDNGFSLEPGHFGHLLADNGTTEIRFFGKPFPEVYELLEKSLPTISPDKIAMCGDTLHTDIMGAAARNWRTVLITNDGLFSGHDTNLYIKSSNIYPDWRAPRI